MGYIVLKRTDYEKFTLETSFKTVSYIDYKSKTIKVLPLEDVLEFVKQSGKERTLTPQELKNSNGKREKST